MEPVTESLTPLSSTTTPTPGPRELGQDDFLRLLVTQLQNQDPLNPIDNAAFVAELAQFSELEQSAKQVRLLEESNEAQAESLRFSVLPLVGRQVRIEGSITQFEEQPVLLNYTLASAADSVRLSIQDPTGQVIRTLNIGPQQAGAHQIQWEGKDANGSLVPAGTYRFAVVATDSQGDPIDVSTASILTVTGVRIVDGMPMLLIGDETLDPQFVLDFL